MFGCADTLFCLMQLSGAGDTLSASQLAKGTPSSSSKDTPLIVTGPRPLALCWDEKEARCQQPGASSSHMTYIQGPDLNFRWQCPQHPLSCRLLWAPRPHRAAGMKQSADATLVPPSSAWLLQEPCSTWRSYHHSGLVLGSISSVTTAHWWGPHFSPKKYLFLYPPGILVLLKLGNAWEDVFQNKQ